MGKFGSRSARVCETTALAATGGMGVCQPAFAATEGVLQPSVVIAVALAVFVLVLLVLIQRLRSERDAANLEAERRVEEATRLRGRLRAAAERIPLPFWWRDEEGNVTFHNSDAAPIIEQSGKNLTLFDRALRRGSAQRESRSLVVDGSRRLFELTEAPMEAGGTIGTARDVSAIEETQAELARHVDAHAEVLEKLQTAIAIFGPDRRLSMANTAFAELWRIDPDRLIGDPTLTEVLELGRESRRLPEQADFRAWRDTLNRLFNHLIDTHEELMFLPDGSTVRMVVVPHPFGGLLMTFEDVTDRVTLEQSFHLLTAVQRETIDHLGDGLAVFGVDGRLRLFNPVFLGMWRLEEGALEEAPHFDVVLDLIRGLVETDEVGWSEMVGNWQHATASRVEFENRLNLTDGKTLQVNGTPLPDGALMISFRDVSDSLAVTNALRDRAEALEMADQIKSEFLANVSYELRTPLNAIVGFSEILQDGYAGDLSERQKEYAGAIRESSSILIRLVNDILDLTSIEAGYLELEKETITLEAIAEQLRKVGFERARSRDIDFSVFVQANSSPMFVDERRIVQALNNLVSNAFIMTPSGGKVTVELTEEPDEFILRVKDSGPGFDLEDGDQIFGGIQRGNKQRTSALGLALVKSLVELHDGTVALESTSPEGTSIICAIPKEEAAEPVPA